MGCLKCNVITSLITAIVYFNCVHSAYYDYCLGDLNDYHWNYSRGELAYKNRYFDIPINDEDHESYKLKNDKACLLDSDNYEKFKVLEVQKNTNGELQRKITEIDSEKNQSLHVHNYVTYIVKNINQPDVLLNAELYCLLKANEFFLTLQSPNYYSGRVSYLLGSVTALSRLQVCFVNLTSYGFIYKTGEKNHSFAKQNISNSSKSEFTDRYSAYLERKSNSQNTKVYVMPLTFCAVEVCRVDLDMIGFEHPTAQGNYWRINSHENITDIDDITGFSNEYYKYLKDNADSYSTNPSRPLNSFQNMKEYKNVIMDFKGMPANFCLYAICIDHLRSSSFIQNAVTIANVYSNMKTKKDLFGQLEIEKSFSDFVQGFYEYLDNYYKNIDENFSNVTTIEKWCEDNAIVFTETEILK